MLLLFLLLLLPWVNWLGRGLFGVLPISSSESPSSSFPKALLPPLAILLGEMEVCSDGYPWWCRQGLLASISILSRAALNLASSSGKVDAAGEAVVVGDSESTKGRIPIACGVTESPEGDIERSPLGTEGGDSMGLVLSLEASGLLPLGGEASIPNSERVVECVWRWGGQ